MRSPQAELKPVRTFKASDDASETKPSSEVAQLETMLKKGQKNVSINLLLI